MVSCKSILSILVVLIAFLIAIVFQQSAKDPPVFTEQEVRTILSQDQAWSTTNASFVRLKDGEILVYIEIGNPSGRPLLCLQGLGPSVVLFNRYHKFFEENNFRVIIPNLLGDLANYHKGVSVVSHAERANELMEKLGISSFYVAGLSYGTLPALIFAKRYPQKVIKVGLLGPMLSGNDITEDHSLKLKSDARSLIPLMIRAPRVGFALGWLMQHLLPQDKNTIKRLFLDDQVPKAEVDWVEENIAWFMMHMDLATKYQGGKFIMRAWELLATETILDGHPIDSELFIITGEFDNVHLPEFARVIHQHAPKSKLVIHEKWGRFAGVTHLEECFTMMMSY